MSIRIYNVLGELVDVVKDGIEDAGYKSAQWDGSRFASGMYFYRLEAVSTSDPNASFSQIRKMMLVK